MKLQPLPIAYQDFGMLRTLGCVYVDKTQYLLSMIENCQTRVFLSRPRRFGKSLTLSTLKAMFEGKAELFKGLAAEEWVKEQQKQPAKVIHLSMPVKRSDLSAIKSNIQESLEDIAAHLELKVESETIQGYWRRLIRNAAEKYGPVVILIDEYDGSILDHLDKPDEAEKVRKLYQSLYVQFKENDAYIRFLMLTGISKFSKLGLFSGMNNLEDISMDEENSTLCGYTQEELEQYFSDRIELLAEKKGQSYAETLQELRNYYDGFSFDGIHKIYNPWSVLNCLRKMRVEEYWYNSASPEFLVKYLKQRGVSSPDEFRGKVVERNFTSSTEIETAEPESLLYQAGYLTISIVSRDGEQLTLDYPNTEVLKAMSRLYFKSIYKVKDYITRGDAIRDALNDGDIETAMAEFSGVLTVVPYSDFALIPEGFYRSLLLVVLCASGVPCVAEAQTSLGRFDVAAMFDRRICVFELKVVHAKETAEQRLRAAKRQIASRRYGEPFEMTGKPVTKIAVVIDDETHSVVKAEGLNF